MISRDSAPSAAPPCLGTSAPSTNSALPPRNRSAKLPVSARSWQQSFGPFSWGASRPFPLIPCAGLPLGVFYTLAVPLHAAGLPEEKESHELTPNRSQDRQRTDWSRWSCPSLALPGAGSGPGRRPVHSCLGQSCGHCRVRLAGVLAVASFAAAGCFDRDPAATRQILTTVYFLCLLRLFPQPDEEFQRPVR